MSDNILDITEEEKKAIKKLVNRSDNELEEDIRIIKEWLKKQPHLPQDEDGFLIRNVLYLNNYSLEKTKKKIDMFYSVKSLVPEFYTNREPLNALVSKQMDDVVLLLLPRVSHDITRVIIFKLLDNDVSKVNISTCIKLIFGICDYRMFYDQVTGDHIILDFENLTFAHLLLATPTIVKQCYDVLHKAYSDKIKGIHIVNVPSVGSTLITMFNNLVSAKLGGRIHVHADTDSLKESISEKILPNEYGGTGGPLMETYEEWKKFYRSKNDWLKKVAERRSDESKRIGEPLDSDMFGMGGSFRTLNLE